MSFSHVDRSFSVMRRLTLENARLHRVCTQAKGMAARHEILLREGDHRIKNSLQVVASLLEMQAIRETSAPARNALHAAASRIQAVARIHDALQLDGGEDVVDLGALIETMSKSLHAMSGGSSAVEIIVDVESVQTPLLFAQPIALIVNELIINALRHAFPNDRAGAVIVTVARNGGELQIGVSDNGVGLPAGYAETHGYGMTLVRAMVAKVGGRLEVENSAGARFTLSAALSPAAVEKESATHRVVASG